MQQILGGSAMAGAADGPRRSMERERLGSPKIAVESLRNVPEESAEKNDGGDPCGDHRIVWVYDVGVRGWGGRRPAEEPHSPLCCGPETLCERKKSLKNSEAGPAGNSDGHIHNLKDRKDLKVCCALHHHTYQTPGPSNSRPILHPLFRHGRPLGR